jgi:hypothetical protein
MRCRSGWGFACPSDAESLNSLFVLTVCWMDRRLLAGAGPLRYCTSQSPSCSQLLMRLATIESP